MDTHDKTPATAEVSKTAKASEYPYFDVRLTLHITMARQIAEAANERGISRQEFIRFAILRELERPKPKPRRIEDKYD